MEHKMLHNAPSLDLSLIIFSWKKSRKIDHVSWIATELIWNLTFPDMSRHFAHDIFRHFDTNFALDIFDIFVVFRHVLTTLITSHDEFALHLWHRQPERPLVLLWNALWPSRFLAENGSYTFEAELCLKTIPQINVMLILSFEN